ncbi:MAG: G-D-S-L family lipolytic protein, partial [Anaerolineae bacterium]|nr:G-D-S-L family lipolytic protein [Anaerolineae bacterium]
MPLTLHPDDPRLTWPGATSLQHTDEWTSPWRIPYEDRELFPPQALQERAAMPAGVRLAFCSDTRFVAGSIVPEENIAPIDLCCDGEPVGTVELTGKDRFQFDDLPAGEKLIELWLPQVGRFRLRSL